MADDAKYDKAWFRGLPAAEQQRILELNDQISRFAFRYAAGVLIAPPDAPMAGGPRTIFNGSCFALKLERGGFLCTAWHVVEHWLRRRAAGEPVLFQVGEVGLNVEETNRVEARG